MTALIPRVRFGVSETRLALGFGMTKKIIVNNMNIRLFEIKVVVPQSYDSLYHSS